MKLTFHRVRNRETGKEEWEAIELGVVYAPDRRRETLLPTETGQSYDCRVSRRYTRNDRRVLVVLTRCVESKRELEGRPLQWSNYSREAAG